MYISHSVMDRLGVKATNSKARGVKAKDLPPEAKAKDTPAGLEAKAVASRTPSLAWGCMHLAECTARSDSRRLHYSINFGREINKQLQLLLQPCLQQH